MTKSRHIGKGTKPSFNDLSNPWQRFRSQTGMGQIELAKLLGISQPGLCAYEKRPDQKGFRSPRVEVAKRFIELAKQRRVRMSFSELYPTTTTKGE